MALSYDATHHFVRTPREIVAARLAGTELTERAFLFTDMPEPGVRNGRGFKVLFFPFRLAFCSRMYNGVEVQRVSVGPSTAPPAIAYLYSAKALDEFIAGAKLAEHAYWELRHGTRHTARLKSFLDGEPADHAEFFEARCEAITLASRPGQREHRLVFNPELQTLDFAKVLGPWEAFQELDMFFARLAAPESAPPVVIEDKYRIAQRGFDRFSFRKAPSKRRG